MCRFATMNRIKCMNVLKAILGCVFFNSFEKFGFSLI